MCRNKSQNKNTKRGAQNKTKNCPCLNAVAYSLLATILVVNHSAKGSLTGAGREQRGSQQEKTTPFFLFSFRFGGLRLSHGSSVK